MNVKVKSILRNILNMNYHTCALSVYLVSSGRRQFLPVARKIKREFGGGYSFNNDKDGDFKLYYRVQFLGVL